MPAEVFVDTSAWYEIATGEGARAGATRKALKARISAGARVVTTNLVLAESHALLVKRKGRAIALRFLNGIIAAPGAVVVVSPDQQAMAIRDWLVPYDDRDFSFADAVSFAVMKSRGIREALTLDHHFAVAGFVATPG